MKTVSKTLILGGIFVFAAFGYEIDSPVKVIIEIGGKTIDCSSGFDYYEIKKLMLND